MIQIRPYRPEDRETWDSFVREQSRNGTLFHEQRFLSYHPEGRFAEAGFIFEEEGRIIGVIPAAAKDGNSWISHPGSSCGGLIFEQKCGLREVLAMLELWIREAQARGIEKLEIRLAEDIFAWPVSGELSFALWHRGFTLKSREISTCIPFEADYNWLDWGRKKNIFDIRKAEKDGYTVQCDSDPTAAWHLVNQNLDTRYQKAPTHSLEEINSLHSLYPERIHPWVCRNADGVPVACVICFEANRFAIHDFYISQDYKLVKGNLLPFVFHHILQHYASKGYQWFNFGISSRADWIKWGILEFKERIGGRAVNRDTWELNGVQQYQPYTETGLIE